MRRQSPDRYTAARGRCKCSRRQRRRGRRVAVGRERDDRRAGAAQADAEHRRIVERERLGQARDERRPRRLMPAVAHRLAQVLVACPISSARTKQQRALQIEDGVAQRHLSAAATLPRVRRVRARASGVATTSRTASGHGHDRAMTRPSSCWQLTVRPPSSAAAALSGCPSISVASDEQIIAGADGR